MTERLGADGLLAPLERALAGAPADEVELHAHRRVAAIARFTRNAVHQNARSDETHVTARVAVGSAVGVARGNGTDPASLRALLERAAALARQQPPNEEWPGVAGAEPHAAPHAFDAETAALDPGEQARAVARVVRAAEERGHRAAGTHHLELREDAVATSGGARAYAPTTLAYVRALAQTAEGGAGYADDLSPRAAALDPDGVVARALAKAERDRDRRQLEPGDHQAVFEDLAVAELLRVVSLTGLGAQAVREGRSFMSERIGERVTGERFTLHDDALDPRQLALPFDVEGTPRRRVALVERGVARGPVHDRTSAKADGTVSTGHAADRSRHPAGGLAGALVMEGGDASIEELVAGVRRGVLITRFHYTNIPDPRSATMTGTSRDGTFLIEDGRIAGALANVRFTMSALDLFAGIEALGRPRLVRDWWSTNGMGEIMCVAPAMRVSRATITGSSPL